MIKIIENLHETFIYSISFLLNDNYFVSGGGDNKICVYRIYDNNFEKIYEKKMLLNMMSIVWIVKKMKI